TNIINEGIVYIFGQKQIQIHSSKKHRNTQYPLLRSYTPCPNLHKKDKNKKRTGPGHAICRRSHTHPNRADAPSIQRSGPPGSSIWLTPAAARSPSWRERLATNLGAEHPAIPPATARQDEAY
uniref:Uncharacterized protein n=1 Tax=Aegilops tauschii subsp. strangulata TaxID=200361 RepID=A0A452ZR57_AEGTS